ncbi:MAG: acyl-CoA dehydrogenase family protein [Spongiibacteraceae bacterium]
MQLAFAPEEDLFRAEVRDWIHANKPRTQPPLDTPALREYDLAWQRKQFDAGYAGIGWPKEYGGLGLSLTRQLIWYEEYAKAQAPFIGTCFVGLAHGGPTLIARANEEHKSFHLPKILRGDVVWCQGFSEPSAGSDLASLRTRAHVDGDHLVVNGQKVWTSYADVADYQELLVRTDPDAPKHKGISWVICDMKTPGITVRPIQMMDGRAEFCEVFYDNVRIPLKNVVGELNDGWSVAMSTLSFERGTAFIADQVELAVRLQHLVELAQQQRGLDGRPLIQHDDVAEKLATMRAEVTALRAMTYATVSRNLTRTQPTAEGSLIRVFFTGIQHRLHQLAMELQGNDSLKLPRDKHDWSRNYLYNFASTIAAGAEQIQRNIIAERVLGLPRSR